jgi:hypothetical protein
MPIVPFVVPTFPVAIVLLHKWVVIQWVTRFIASIKVFVLAVWIRKLRFSCTRRSLNPHPLEAGDADRMIAVGLNNARPNLRADRAFGRFL